MSLYDHLKCPNCHIEEETLSHLAIYLKLSDNWLLAENQAMEKTLKFTKKLFKARNLNVKFKDTLLKQSILEYYDLAFSYLKQRVRTDYLKGLAPSTTITKFAYLT